MKNLTKQSEPAAIQERLGRRGFLRYAGFSVAATAAILTACENPSMDATVEGNAGARVSATAIDLGSGDVGVLNYAYALEQLEFAFYDQVLRTPYANISNDELMMLREIRDHEYVHKEFFRVALGAAGIPALTPNFRSIDFSQRQVLLNAARVFEDTGVGAYNGAGQLLGDVNLLLLAGKIVSVEARHAGLIRDLLLPQLGYFAGDNIVDGNTGLDPAYTPSFVLPNVQPFIMETITANNLPRV